MDKSTILGDIGFSFGIASIFMVIAPLFKLSRLFGTTKNAVSALLIGIVGLILTNIQSKKHTDEMTKFVFLINLTAIVLAALNLIFFWIS